MSRKFASRSLAFGLRAFLRIAVHVEAVRLDPVHYARCLIWLAMGKRLRGRLGLAPLLGRTRYAYDLWRAEREPIARMAISDGSVDIIALVQDGNGIEDTLASLSKAGIEACIIRDDAGTQLAELVCSQKDAWLMPLASGDRISANAGTAYRTVVDSMPATTHLIYADDDLIDHRGRRRSPHLKPDWNRELYRHFDYLTGAAIMRLEKVVRDDIIDERWSETLASQAALRTEEVGGEVIHIPEILHHRAARPSPRLPLRSDISVESWPSVTVVVPTRDRADLLRTCLAGIERTDYPGKLDVIVIDNGSVEADALKLLTSLDPAFARVLRDDQPFNFADLNNSAAREATGDLLCFVNNDIEVIETGWLRAMACQAQRECVGAVGAQLLYPDGRIQHAGVVTGIGGAAAHAHRLLDPEEEGYFHRHKLPQFVSAVTAACMLVERTKFEAVGGFDADHFAVSFNDVDLCLKLRARGWQNLYEPRARLVHHESVSRGLDRDSRGAARQAREVAALQNRWRTELALTLKSGQERAHDPYHHSGLSPLSEQFVLRL